MGTENQRSAKVDGSYGYVVGDVVLLLSAAKVVVVVVVKRRKPRMMLERTELAW